MQSIIITLCSNTDAFLNNIKYRDLTCFYQSTTIQQQPMWCYVVKFWSTVWGDEIYGLTALLPFTRCRCINTEGKQVCNRGYILKINQLNSAGNSNKVRDGVKIGTVLETCNSPNGPRWCSIAFCSAKRRWSRPIVVWLASGTRNKIVKTSWKRLAAFL